MKATHRVQSIRGTIERGFAALKKWFILFGGNSTSIKTKEMELDLAAALENLRKRFKANLMEGIPARPPYPPDAHIITKPTDAQLKIPRQIDFKSDHFPRRLLDLNDFLRAVVPQHLVGVLGVGGDAVYSSRIMARAKNMRAGGHVLQLRVQKSGMSDWWICASVGASMRITTYNCYLLVRENVGLVKQACDCLNG